QVASVNDGDESDPTAGVFADLIVIDAPFIASASAADAVLLGQLTTGDVITLRFNEEMDPNTVLGTVITVSDGTDVTLIACVAAPIPVADDGITQAVCALGDGVGPDTVNNDTLTITI